MRKFLLVAVAALIFGGVSRADSFTISTAEQGTISSTVNSDITGDLLGYVLNVGGAQTDYVQGEAALLTGEGYQTTYQVLAALGGPLSSAALQALATADADYLTAQTDFDALAKALGDGPITFQLTTIPAPEPGTFLLLAIGLTGLLIIRKRKSSSVAIKAAA
jgi:hypothetical protein